MNSSFLHIPNLLNQKELVAIDDLIAGANFVDGKLTASMAAKEVKNNFQIEAGNDALIAVQNILDAALAQSPLFNIALLPKQIYPFLISKYGVGNYYGWHVDSPIMGKPALRTDMAMTIFLSEPESYVGGELLIQQGSNIASFKPAKGDAILYPCQFLHCVNKIESGERIAAVTWVQSNVKNMEQRDMLFQLNQIHGSLSAQAPHAAETSMLLQLHSNLFRMWADV